MVPYDAANLPSRPGTYVLGILMQHKKEIQVGKLGRFVFQIGAYTYVGSAFGPGGLAARLNRHLRKTKRKHWHIDFLRPHACIVGFWMMCGAQSSEHRWAQSLTAKPLCGIPIPGFGSSDCGCRSHLFYFNRMPDYNIVCEALRAEWLWSPKRC